MLLSVLRNHWPQCSWRALSISLLVSFAFVLLLFTKQQHRAQDSSLGRLPRDFHFNYSSPRHSPPVLPAFCNASDVSKVAISIKTGATEPRNKVPTQLMTFLQCIPDVMLFSDLDQRIGSYGLEDVLAAYSEDSTQSNLDFALYREQQRYAHEGREIELRKLAKLPVPYEDWRSAGKRAAWGLDKYKFVNMIMRAGERQPGKDWYVFIEADTYLVVSNLLRFLESQDPKQKLYFGNAVRMWEHPTPLDFAHGGSGFIVSGAAVEAFVQVKERIARTFTPRRISQWWFGDFVVADALEEALRVHVTDATPMMNSEESALLPFDENVWCMPVVTLHHMDARQFDDMYKFHTAGNFSELLFRDVYAATFRNGLPLMGEMWDNLSGDERYELEVKPNDLSRIREGSEDEGLRNPHASYKGCEAACDQNGNCFQFSWAAVMKQKDFEVPVEETKCHLSRVFRFGREVQEDEHLRGTRWISGWRTDRIRKFIDDHQECPDVHFGVD